MSKETEKLTTLETSFKEELATLINKYSVENVANIPDYMMAELIVDFISTLGPLIKKRDRWMGYVPGSVSDKVSL